MTTNDDRATLKLSGPADLAEAVPYLFGFYPNDSVVLVAFDAARQLCGSMRMDMPKDSERAEATGEAVGIFLGRVEKRNGMCPTNVGICVYQDPGEGQLHGAVTEALRPLADGFLAAFSDRGVNVLEALCVSDGCWWSFMCADPSCCGPEGTKLRTREKPGVVAVAATVAGLTSQGSRQDIAASFAPLTGEGAMIQAQAIEDALPFVRAHVRTPAGIEQLRSDGERLLRTAVEEFQAGAERLDESRAARLILALSDKELRDWACAYCEPEQLAAARRLWRELATRCVARFRYRAAAPLTLLAWTSWVAGDSATARVALAAALEIDPDYVLAGLLHEAVNQGSGPEALLDAVRGLRAPRPATVPGQRCASAPPSSGAVA